MSVGHLTCIYELPLLDFIDTVSFETSFIKQLKNNRNVLSVENFFTSVEYKKFFPFYTEYEIAKKILNRILYKESDIYIEYLVSSILNSVKNKKSIYIEQPEIFIPPDRYEVYIEFLIEEVINKGVHLVLETTNELFLDVIRYLIKISKINYKNYNVLLLDIKTNDIKEIQYDINGRLSGWPQGFCSQTEYYLDKLLG